MLHPGFYAEFSIFVIQSSKIWDLRFFSCLQAGSILKVFFLINLFPFFFEVCCKEDSGAANSGFFVCAF